jgi:ribose transport system substrate-binding protein
MHPLRTLGLAAATLAALGLSSCNKNSGRPKVAFISNNAYDFWKIAQRGTEKAAEDFRVDVEFKMPSAGSAEQQRQIIEDLLAKGIQGIAISPNDAANQTEFFKDEVSPKVPLITQDSDLPDPSARRCYIGTDNYKAGRAVGELVKKAVPGGGSIVIYVGKLDVQNAKERRQGVIDELTGRKRGKVDPNDKNLKCGKYTLITTMTDGADSAECQRKAEDTLTKYPEVKCLIGLWEYNPPALLKAVQSSKLRRKPVIVGFDENEETLEGIKRGLIVATVVQNPYEFGYQAIKILAGLARGDESVLKTRTDIDKEGRIFIPHRVITKENVDEFHKQLRRLKGG